MTTIYCGATNKMKTKLIMLVIIGLFITSLETFRISSGSNQEELAKLEKAEDRGTIDWHVRRAKIKGENHIILRAPVAQYANEVSDLDEAISNFSLVLVKPISKQSYLHSELDIITWYKFKIFEVLSKNINQKDINQCDSCNLFKDLIPKDMLPLSHGEILIPKAGGTMQINEVKVEMVDPEFPEFSLSQEYLVFLKVSPSGELGIMRMGPTGVFSVENTETIHPINKQLHPLKQNLKIHYNESIEQLRTYIRNKQPSQQSGLLSY